MKNKILIGLALFGLIFGSIVGVKLTQARTTVIKGLPAFQKIYQGNFDIAQPGDVITHTGGYELHWKRLNIPEISVSNMPNISCYFLPHSFVGRFFPEGSWVMYNVTSYPIDQISLSYDHPVSIVSVVDGALYVWYKTTLQQGQIVVGHLINGDYKIVVTYTKGAVAEEVAPAEKLIRLKNTPGVYLANDQTNEKRPITDVSIFKNYGYNWKDVKEVSKTELDSYKTTEPLKLKDQTIVKIPESATVYIVENEKLRPIASPQISDLSKAISVPPKVINLHQIGETKD